MPRPNKEGLDYFPLDTNIDQDDKIALLEAKHGIISFGVIIKLFKKIYANKGYYYEWNEQTQLLFSRQVGLDFKEVNEIVVDALKWDLFNKNLFKKHGILTSKRIQMTYIEATKRRKEIPMLQKYLMNGVNGYINNINANIIFIDVDKSTQTETETETETETDSPMDLCKQIISYLNEKAEKNFKPDTKATRDKIKARTLEGYVLEDFKKVIDIKTAKWKTDPKMNEFLRPETLFGNKFDGYLNEKIIDKSKPDWRRT